MHSSLAENNAPYDSIIDQIATYVIEQREMSPLAMQTAAYCLMDSIGCGLLALQFPECTKMLGPVVPGANTQNGARVFGTSHELDPITAAFNMGTLIRWLDYNDTWLAAEWGHPSDNFGAILAVTDYLDRNRPNTWTGARRWTIRDVLLAAIQAYEIQGVLALTNSFNRVGLDHVLLVRIASTAVSTAMLGGSHRQVCQALSQAWIDGGALRTYRHAPNTGSRKSWAAGDATRRAVQLALWTLRGEMGYTSALSAPRWGFQDVLYGGKPITLSRSLDSYVMENILFKVSFPAEFHAQTSAEAAIQLHPQVRDRMDQIETIRIETHESAIRIINKTGPLHNPADRDHCIQYITAVALLYGELRSEHYEEAASKDPRIDVLRNKMEVVEAPRYSIDYLDPEKRSIANAVQITFADGSQSERVEIEYPLGHRFRRQESLPKLREKFIENASTCWASSRVTKIIELFDDQSRLEAMPVAEWMEMLVESI